MIQRKYIELKRAGVWVLYRVAYYYKNKPRWYYELHEEDRSKKVDDVFRFGQKKFDDLKKIFDEKDKETVDLSNVKVIDSEKLLIDWM